MSEYSNSGSKVSGIQSLELETDFSENRTYNPRNPDLDEDPSFLLKTNNVRIKFCIFLLFFPLNFDISRGFIFTIEESRFPTFQLYFSSFPGRMIHGGRVFVK